jgi:hypothetical protein
MKLFRADELGAGENTPESEEISNSYNQQKRTAEGGCPHIDQDFESSSGTNMRLLSRHCRGRRVFALDIFQAGSFATQAP